MKEIPTIARPAIIEELTNLTKKGVLTGRHWVDLTPTQRSRILRSHTNVTHKVTPASDGTGRTTDKVKARVTLCVTLVCNLRILERWVGVKSTQ